MELNQSVALNIIATEFEPVYMFLRPDRRSRYMLFHILLTPW